MKMHERNRDDWEFTYLGHDLHVAAESKRKSHEGRKKWWENKKREVMDKVRESGIEVQDSVAAIYSNTKGAFGPQITIDATLQRELSECQTKILEHDEKEREYDAWVQILSANKNAEFKLKADDWMFFFGK